MHDDRKIAVSQKSCAIISLNNFSINQLNLNPLLLLLLYLGLGQFHQGILCKLCSVSIEGSVLYVLTPF